MTREEAKALLESRRDLIKSDYPEIDDYREALEIAIKALEQEPCEDIARCDFQTGDEVRIIGSDPIFDDCDVGWVIRNASEKAKTMYVMRNDGSAGEEAKAEWYKTGRHNAMLAEVIKALPSVTQKSGKWIEDILDKIRAEIERKAHSGQWSNATMYGMLKAVAIIDKYKAESEEWI